MSLDRRSVVGTGGAPATFSAELLQLDPERETERIVAAIREGLQRLRRKGLVVGLSGGIDSSVCAALCARAVGSRKVLGLFMPEHDSSSDSERLGRVLAEHYGIPALRENIGPALEGIGCYSRRDDAIRSVVPDYSSDDKSKLVMPLLGDGVYRTFFVVVQKPDGRQVKARLNLDAYQTIVAATNFKQRVRKMVEYFHADRLRYAVVGTPNRLEYDQGFFVKNGDGAADLKPIAHLYKSQVYQLAEHLGVPEEIRRRPPTTDTFSLEQSQEEFFFSVPLRVLDLCLHAKNHGYSPADVCEATGLTAEQAEEVFRDIDAKRAATRYLHENPSFVNGEQSLAPSPGTAVSSVMTHLAIAGV